MLIGGISSTSLRATALSLGYDSVEGFLDRMRNIAEGSTEQERKSAACVNPAKERIRTCRNCGTGHNHKDCRDEIVCFYCKKKGHRQYDCPSLMEKSRKPTTPLQQMASTPVAVSEDASADESGALISEAEHVKLHLSESLILINSMEGRSCNLTAMVDTGSPVFFVKYSVYLLHIKPSVDGLASTNRKFVNIKNTIRYCGHC